MCVTVKRTEPKENEVFFFLWIFCERILCIVYKLFYGACWGYDHWQIKGMWACLWIILLSLIFPYTLLVNMYFLAITVPDVLLNTAAICACGIGDLLPTHPLHDQSLEKVSVWKPVEKLVESRECWITGRPVESRVCACDSYWLEEVMRGEETAEDYSTTMGWGLWEQVAPRHSSGIWGTPRSWHFSPGHMLTSRVHAEFCFSACE